MDSSSLFPLASNCFVNCVCTNCLAFGKYVTNIRPYLLFLIPSAVRQF
jgi:hypothetical protein